ncbi:EAL domain-containing protein [Methylobacter sp.]|uniref:putative bifunctional diguanylate cyclase/phosphodiesterase n=1 Tax=Methylobacter sp. TaxID=2051955 RepID=UPI00121D6818|nr:EAL domain-containing protein [Methylobacter sp.]TAK62901.1 MAG: EAL domain-containing protein [Methylobacter sp.]
MTASFVTQTTNDNHIAEKVMPKKPKKTVARTKQNQNALHKNKIEALQALQNSMGKLHVFSTQLTYLIDSISDTVLLNDREGRKLITNELTKNLFRQHDLNWYGKADIALAIARQQAGANHAYDEMSLKSELHSALAKRQFKLYYQIQVNSDRQILGAEALLRWKHPEYGLVTPDQFIPIAEQTGLILPIGIWVLNAACKQLKLWQSDSVKKDLSIAINISPSQFSHPEFVEQLSYILNKTGINPALLKLELTESLMLHDISNTIEKMEMLKSMGIQFSMDNFGTGYSSLFHLKKLPIDQLKIDQFLMRDIVIDNFDAMIVKAIVEMTNKLGISVTAGGVETEQQFICLKRFQCSSYQGYLFGKPMPLNKFEELISQVTQNGQSTKEIIE